LIAAVNAAEVAASRLERHQLQVEGELVSVSQGLYRRVRSYCFRTLNPILSNIFE
jgi:hypothetical protein